MEKLPRKCQHSASFHKGSKQSAESMKALFRRRAKAPRSLAPVWA